jgi:glycosyltransferase involved in cell wall biosynthesis
VTITNGYDEDDFDILPDEASKPGEPFSLLYLGSLYPEYQNPLPLFQAIRQLRRDSFIQPGDLVIRFVGTNPEYLREVADELGILSYLEFLAVVSHAESIKLQCQSIALLLLKWNDQEEKGVCPVKLYEYLGAERPVLAVGDYQDVTDEILQTCEAGISARSKHEISEILRFWLTIYQNTGELPWNNNMANTKKYTRAYTAGALARLLDDIVMSKRAFS